MRADIARYEKNLREELDGSALYAALAAAEVDPVRKDLFLQLSQAEAGHAQLWRERLTAAGGNAGRFTPSFRTRVIARLAQRFGPRFVLPAIGATSRLLQPQRPLCLTSRKRSQNEISKRS